MENIIRICGCVTAVNIADNRKNLSNIFDHLNSIPHGGIDITLLPNLAISSPSSSSLLANALTYHDHEKTIKELKEFSSNRSGYLIVGITQLNMGRLISSMAIFYDGELIGFIPTQVDSSSENMLSSNAVFTVGNLRATLHTTGLDNLVNGAQKAADNFCDLLLVPTYEPITAGKIKNILNTASTLSKSLGISIAIVNGGSGETSSPHLYHGFTAIFENGVSLSVNKSFSGNICSVADIDADIIRSVRLKPSKANPTSPIHSIEISDKYGSLLRDVVSNPFLPRESWDKAEYLGELFEYQTQSLMARMSNVHIDNLIVGVSGGLDSTIALLVAINACDKLGLPRDNVHGITLPGLGTSQRTYYNALALLENLGVTMRDISIRSAVLQHFEDISHPGMGSKDTTYENAQARERTQILLDIANMINGLVVGSSDLSEIALGFSTFGGDHLAGYNVNACMTKTMLRELLIHIIDSNLFDSVKDFLIDIAETPVSPELLPPREDGEISQITEDILGPYELHEFFLYYLVGYNLRPAKIYNYAVIAFNGVYDKDFIKSKLELFIKKFCTNHFKRSFAPDAASITEVNLLGVTYSIPSDFNPAPLLEDLKTI